MSLSQNLVQKQTQKLVITQELRQSIELLPMSNLELSEKIHQELLENPLLEDTSLDQNSNEYNAEETENFKLEIDSSAETDIQNSDNFSQQFSSSQHSDSKHQFLENAVKSPVTLKDSLFSQLKLLDLKKEEIHAGEALISDLNEKGFLRTSIEDLSQGLGIPVPTLRKILEQIYCLDPIGCGAKDIHESLSIQAKILIPDDLITHEILLNHFESLEKLDYKTIEKKTGFTQEEIQKSIQIIKKLEPFPGTVFESMKTDYIVPDVIVVERNKNFEVVINDDWIPSLSINEEYVNLMKTPVLNKKDKNYFQTKMESADWLIKSIGQRRKTLFTVMNEIVNYQKEFFLNGPGHLMPMTLKDIADSENVNLHDSTVSRITANKFVQTKWGIFQLKYFFSGSLNSQIGTMKHSAKNIQEKIKKLVDEETLENILSDQDLVDRIAAEGILIARRTVAKYRKILNILPAERRKKIKEINLK